MPFHGLLMALGIIREAARLHARYRFDLVDGHFIFPDGMAAALSAQVLKIPVVLSARGSDIHQFSTFRTIRPQIVHTLRRADRIISVCAALKDSMGRLGISAGEIDVIPNGIDANRFAVLDRFEARERLGIPKENKLILAVGSLVPVKRHDRLIRALPMVLKRHPKARVYVVGEGPERNALQAEVVSIGLSEQVKLVGHRPNIELWHWHNAADTFCLASSREGWANVIMESLACGTPVVATNVFGAPEIVTHSHVGTLVDQTTESIASGLIAALDRKWDRVAIRKHVEGRSWDVVAREVEAVFQQVLDGRKRQEAGGKRIIL